VQINKKGFRVHLKPLVIGGSYWIIFGDPDWG
jgi:hypothetical protein